jgi:hypothetical protein
MKKSEEKRIQEALQREIDVELEAERARAIFVSMAAIATLKADEKRNLEDVQCILGEQRELENSISHLKEMFDEKMDLVVQGETDLFVKLHHIKSLKVS